MTENNNAPATAAGPGLRDLRHDRRALAMIGAAVVAVGALGYFVVLPLFGGSSSASTANASGAVIRGKARVAAHASPNAAAAPALPTPAPQFNVRDPFSPLYVAPSAAAVGPSTPPSAAPAAAVSPAAAAPPQTIVVVQPGPTTTVTKAPTPRYTLVLERTTPGTANTPATATLLVNGTPTTVSVGQPFPNTPMGPFALTQVPSSKIAEFVYGEQPFSMEVGETRTAS